ncbi:hypothetical protein F4801DRAFT_603408 [Xylaria longipes]|nr:hypothetical protein F4801DRAFT_603408 [Xylaria longipes]
MAFDSNAALYPQYKQDTTIIAQWLDSTSKAHGFICSSGRQRQAGVKKQYTICIADFGLMAEFLSRKGPVSIPSYVWSSLSRAIRYRTTYGDYLQQQRHTNTAQDTTEHKKHLFFVDVLRKVLNILNRIPKPATPVAPRTQTTPIATRFASLDVPRPATVEDDVEDDVSTSVRTNASPEPPENDVLFEPWKEDEEEALFQWRLLNMDMQRIRKQIRQLWEQYRAGHLGLAGVATAHNMAIHVVWKLERDIHPAFEKHGDYVNLAITHFQHRYIGSAMDSEEIEARLARLLSVVDAIIDGFDIAEEEMVFAWQALFIEAQVWSQCGTFCSKPWGPFIPRDDRQNMTNLEKYKQDMIVASGVAQDLQILAIYLNPHVGMKLDELSTAIKDLVPRRLHDLRKHISKHFPSVKTEITLRAAFALQLLLDSTHVLGTSFDRPRTELLDKTARIFKSAKSLRQFYEGPGALALGRLPGPSFMECIEKTAGFWQDEDPIAEFRRKEEAEPSNPPTEKACTLLRHNAPLCGWWMQTVQATSYSLSIRAARSIHSPLACARLYFAFPDIDAFSTLHRGDLWVGTAPKSGKYFYNLSIASGNSIVSLASDARVSSERFRNEGVRTLTSSAKVSERIHTAFIDRNVEGMSEEDVERLLSDTKVRWYNGRAVRPCFYYGWDKAGNHKGERNLIPSEADNYFLRLAQAIDAETLEQSFDYMFLNRKGRLILDAVYGSYYLEQSWEVAEGNCASVVVGVIFHMIFLQDGTVRRKEASAIADILLNLIKTFGRVVHTSTGIDWAQALECTCADIPS